MDWLIIVIAVVASVLTGIFLYHMNKNNDVKSKKEEVQ